MQVISRMKPAGANGWGLIYGLEPYIVGTARVDTSFATAEVIVQLPSLAGHLVRLFDKYLYPLLEDVEGRQLGRLVLVQGLRRSERKPV